MMNYVITECWKMFRVIYLMQFAALKATDEFLQQLRPANFFVIQVVETVFAPDVVMNFVGMSGS